MATVTARNVDDRDYAMLNELAEANRRSVSAELRAMIAEAARRQRAQKIVAEMRDIRAKSTPLANGKSMLDILREERDSW